ncbi:MAG: gamma-glutamyltransferase family protein [Casimicrobiaceae bacterium]|nr:gamma-glutamyltransferase family protein [Casimicrobiaceae bacterium]
MNFDFSRPYPSGRSPLLAQNVVATSQPLAAQAGLEMLRRGGNAIDAAIAAAAALTVVEPCSNGIGGDLFALLWHPAEKRLRGLNASGRSPRSWSPERFPNGIPETGWQSVTVPGGVSGWVALWRYAGQLPFAELLSPAIELAERGFPVSPVIANQWQRAAVRVRAEPGFAEHFLPGGCAPRAGERFRNPAQAEALRLIAETEGEAFYRGVLANRLVAHAKAHGGDLTGIDLAAHEPEWVEPLTLDYRGFTICELPPNGQGIAALIALGILAHFDLSAWGPDHPNYWHTAIEAIKLAFRDVHAQVADPAWMRVAPEAMLNPAFLARRAALIELDRAQEFSPSAELAGGTVYLATADASGMMVSLIQSNYQGFGSGVVVDGIALHNRGVGFSADPKHPNAIAGGKRPFHTIIPGFVLHRGEPQCAFGVMGGPMQPQGHLQVLTRLLDFHQNPQSALDAPRFRVERGGEVYLEPSVPHALREALSQRGHRLSTPEDPFVGHGQIIWRLPGAYVAGSEPRADGAAVGF